MNASSAAHRIVLLVWPIKNRLPDAIRAHIEHVGFYCAVRRAVNRRLPPLTMAQLLGLKPIRRRAG